MFGNTVLESTRSIPWQLLEVGQTFARLLTYVFIPNAFPDHPSCGPLLNWYWKVTNGWVSGGWNYIWKSVAAARSAALTQLSVERTCRIAAFSLNNEPEKITKKSSKGNWKKWPLLGGVCFLHLFDPIAQNGTCASMRRGNFCLVSQPSREMR